MSDIRSNVDWEQVKQKLKDQYPTLTDNDFQKQKEDKFLIHLSDKLGKTKEEIKDIIRKI
jgi:uncharacterized protein YjbJ (UPF0337 family)